MSKSEMTVGNGLSVLCFAAILIAAACYERPEPNFVAVASWPVGCKGDRCPSCDSGEKCGSNPDWCNCTPGVPLPEPEPEPEPETEPDTEPGEPLPPIEPHVPPDDAGPWDDDGKAVNTATKEIILHSRDNCPPCDSWWANERPKFEAAGWVVALHVLGSNENGRTPFFTVDVNGKQFELQGYQTLRQVEERIGR
jgi:hypothetical protein